MPLRPVGTDGRRVAPADEDRLTTTTSRRRGVGGAPKPAMASRKSSLDRLAAPKSVVTRKPPSKPSTLRTKTKPFSTRPSSATTAGQMRNNNVDNIRNRQSSKEKENNVKVAGNKKATKKEPTSKATTSATSTALRTPRQSTVVARTTKKATSNKTVTFTPATKPGGNRGSGINSLRRSLRETITPPSQKKHKYKLPSSSSDSLSMQSELFPEEQQATPPKHEQVHVEDKQSPELLAPTPPESAALEPPKTPKSILKEQLEITMDESLLVSPSSQSSFQHLHSCLEPTDVVPTDHDTIDVESRVTVQGQSATITTHPEPTRVLDGTQAAKSTGVIPEPSKKKAVLGMKGSVFSASRKDVRSIVKNRQTPTRPAPSTGQGASKEFSLPYETPCMVQNAAKTISSAPVVETPKSKRENGVCLDLTALFFNEQKTVQKCNRKASKNSQAGCQASQHEKHIPAVDKDAVVTANLMPSDERWAEMQCETFSKWLNFTLDPTEESKSPNEATSEGGTEGVKATGNALRTLMLHQYLAKVRSAASNLFQSYEMKRIRGAIDAELEKGRLAIRSDRDMYSNLGHRQKITKLLLSYSTPWLRLGLETLFGENILPDVPSQYSPTKRSLDELSKTSAHQVRGAIRNFIVNRLISDATVLAKYTKGRCKVPSGNFEKRYRAEMRVLVLRRILVLVFFLDRAKQANLLDKAPRLFVKTGSIKSSRDVLIYFCRDFLASEGDITKHLSRVGLKVFYKQEPIEEIETKITNFAVDLRDGIRLTKIVEILTRAGPNTLLKSLRIPAVSRLQKLHNVGVSLGALRDAGVGIPADVAPHHIVDGHRSMVLKLMWAMISHYQSPAALDFDQVEEEIQNLREEFQRRNKIGKTVAILNAEEEPTAASPSSEDRGKVLLLRWCRAVCALFGLPISDFSASFADGKVLCYLVHYYHPKLLPAKEIRPTSHDVSAHRTLSLERARYNEKLNSALAHGRMSELGGIPSMMPSTDTTMEPDEKSMTVYLCYACSRLLASRREVQAIEKIQCHFRYYYRRKLRIKQTKAAVVILREWRARKDQYYLNQRDKFASAVAKIEEFVWSRRHILNRLQIVRLKEEMAELAALKVQNQVRMFLAKKDVRFLLAANVVAINLQRAFRQRKAHQLLVELRVATSAATRCQALWRGCAARQQTLVTLSSIILVQAIVRGHISRRRFLAARKASTCIQRIWRGFWGQLQYQIELLDIVAVQSVVRRRLAMKQRRRCREALLTLQVAVRGYFARCILQRKRRAADALKRGHESATVCQRYVRGFLASRRTGLRRLQFVAATIIQREWRAIEVRILVQRKRVASLRIQCFLRTAKASREFNFKIQSAVRLQKQTRSLLARREYDVKRRSVSILQRIARCWMAKRLALRRLRCVVLCQSLARRHLTQKHLWRQNWVATMVQAVWRSAQQQRLFQNKQLLAVPVQALWRGRQTRQRTSELHANATTIQAVYRRHRSIQQLEHLQLCVVKVQAWWRSVHHLVRHRSTMTGIIKVEALVRGYLTRKQLYQEFNLREALEMSVKLCRDVSSSARIIQCFWRARYQSTFFRKKRALALTLTSLARRKLVWLRLNALSQSTVKIQSAFRRHVASHNREFSLMATIKIQSVWRAYQDAKRYKCTKASTRQLQRLVRAFIIRNKANQQLFLEEAKRSLLRCSVDISQATSKATVLIQRLWRTQLAKQSYSQVRARIRSLQASSRRFLWNRRYERLKHGINLFQRQVRGRLAKKQFQVARHGVVLMQAHFRDVIVKRHQRLQLQSTVVIQSTWRRFAHYHSYQTLVAGVLVLQSLARMKFAQHHFSLQRQAVAQLQNNARSWLAKRRVSNLRKQQAYTREAAALILQRQYRGYSSRAQIQFLHSSAATIQKIWRGFVCLIDYHMDICDIVIVQTVARQWMARWQAKRRLAALVRLQSVARMMCANREARAKWKEQQEILRAQRCSQCIQRVIRGSMARKWAKKQRAARTIQKIWRAYYVHVDYLIVLLGVTTLQAQARSLLAKNRFARQKHAATEIQRVWRGFVESFTFDMKLFSSLRIQQAARAFLAAKRLKKRRAQVDAERIRWMMPLAATTIQVNIRNFLARRTFNRLVRRVSKFQGLVRGHRVRRRRKKRVRITAARLKEAHLRATKTPNMRLGARTLMALNVLQTSRSLAEIMNAVMTLEMSTRFSKACCEAFAHAKATDILLSTIRQCNRSRPHIQLLIYIVRTLRNVALHDSLLTYIATVASCEVVLDLVQSFRDKADIFSVAVFLIERCVVFDDHVMALCKTSENRKRLNGVHNLCKRKSTSSAFGRTPARITTAARPGGNPDMNDGIASLARILARIEASKR